MNKKYVLSIAIKINLHLNKFYEFIREVDDDRIEIIDETGEKEIYMKYNFESDYKYNNRR